MLISPKSVTRFYCGNNPVNYSDASGLISVAVYNGREEFLGKAADNAFMSKRVANPFAASLYLQKLKSMEFNIDKLYIVDHGWHAHQHFGYSKRKRDWIDPYSDDWKQMADAVCEDGKIVLVGCLIADRGLEYLQALADQGGRAVLAYDGLNYPVSGYTGGALYKATPGKGKPEKVHDSIGDTYGDGGALGYIRMGIDYIRRRFLDKNIWY